MWERMNKLTLTKWLAPLCLVGVMVGCSDDDDDNNDVINDDNRQALQSLLDQKRIEGNVPGITLAIHQGGDILTVTSGQANTETGELFTPETRVKVGSITKTFTSIVVLQLIEEGKLSFDDTLDMYLPNRLENYNPEQQTIRKMLQHTSLICNFTDVPPFNWAADAQTDPEMIWAPDELINEVEPFFSEQCAEENTWLYSNTNYVILGEIIEFITGNSYEVEITHRIIDRLGLTNTIVPNNFQDIDHLHSRGYLNGTENIKNGKPEQTWTQTELEPLIDVSAVNQSFTWSSGSVLSTPTDIARWVDAVGSGDMLSEEMQAEYQTTVNTTVAGGGIYFYGLGVMNVPMWDAWGHGGGHPGFDCGLWHISTHDVGIAVCENRTLSSHMRSDNFIVHEILDILFPEEDYPPMPDDADASVAPKSSLGYKYY